MRGCGIFSEGFFRKTWEKPLALRGRQVGLLLLFIILSGCFTTYRETLPSQLSSQIDDTLSFEQVLESPEQHSGKVVLLGGQVLSAKRLKTSTELIILQLPLWESEEPSDELTQSQGRFIALQEEFLDPATIPAGTRVTLVGEITGSSTRSLDETTYTYPTLILKRIQVWPALTSDYRYYGPPPYPYWGPYPYFHPFWGPRGRFYHPYPYGYGW